MGEGGRGRGKQCWGESCRQGRAEGEKGSQALTAVCAWTSRSAPSPLLGAPGPAPAEWLTAPGCPATLSFKGHSQRTLQ